eukprot:5960593-Alexandrium_andersonii.AAC.1
MAGMAKNCSEEEVLQRLQSLISGRKRTGRHRVAPSRRSRLGRETDVRERRALPAGQFTSKMSGARSVAAVGRPSTSG